MSKNRKISTKEFEILKNIDPCVKKSSEDAKKLKFSLLNSIEATMGDKWYSLKKETRQAVDEICFLSAEKGFFYAKPDYISRKSGAGEKTVSRILKTLVDIKVLTKVNRYARTHNGLGSPVYIFINHANYESIKTLLGLNEIPNEIADEISEVAETPTESKDTSVFGIPTYYLTTSFNFFNNMFNNQLNVSTKEVSETTKVNVSETSNQTTIKKWIKYVPNAINEIYANTFGDDLQTLWRKITSASKTIKWTFDKKDIVNVGRNVLQFLMKNDNFGKMTLDEMCAYVYKSMISGLYNMLGHACLEYIEVGNDSSVAVTKPTFRKIVREEMIPEWFPNNNKKNDNSLEKETYGIDIDLEREKLMQELHSPTF